MYEFLKVIDDKPINIVNKRGWHDHDDLACAVVRLLNKVDEGGGMNRMMEINVCKCICLC